MPSLNPVLALLLAQYMFIPIKHMICQCISLAHLGTNARKYARACMRVYLHACMHACIHTCTCTFACISTYVCMHTCMFQARYVHVYLSLIWVLMHASMHVHICAHNIRRHLASSLPSFSIIEHSCPTTDTEAGRRKSTSCDPT